VPLLGIIFCKKNLARCWTIASVLGVAAILSGCGTLSKEEAKSILLDSDQDLQKGIYVDLGYLNGHCGQSPALPKYAALEKAGLISIRDTGTSTEVLTTSKGDRVFKEVGAHVMDSADLKSLNGQTRCNFHSWVIPIATKEMLDLTVTPTENNGADVVYNWKWNPNTIGDHFKIDSDTYRSLNRHQQETLSDGDIPLDNSFPHATKKHFYHDGNGWHLGK